MKATEESTPVCCPPFDPAPWDDVMLEWSGKPFVKASVCTFFYMPLNFGQVMRRLDAQLTKAGVGCPQGLGLSDHLSKWRMDLYLAVEKEVPGLENVALSGRFYSRVYEGPFRDTGKWCADFEKVATSKGLSVKKWYMWYTTCPKCAKKHGKNYVVVLAQIS